MNVPSSIVLACATASAPFRLVFGPSLSFFCVYPIVEQFLPSCRER
jgi:hypothetical protein